MCGSTRVIGDAGAKIDRTALAWIGFPEWARFERIWMALFVDGSLSYRSCLLRLVEAFK